jgi:hypothetical protein
MKTALGPIKKEQLILCSADASPDSQRKHPYPAADFFPNGKWVGALRNTAHTLGCKFVILTTGHGLVAPDDIISPFDAHIDTYPDKVRKLWETTIPRVLKEHRNSLMLFYSGGCPREPYIKIAMPILHTLGISLLSFGKPMMFDVDKIEKCSQMLFRGTSFEEIASILGVPERLEFYFNI